MFRKSDQIAWEQDAAAQEMDSDKKRGKSIDRSSAFLHDNIDFKTSLVL